MSKNSFLKENVEASAKNSEGALDKENSHSELAGNFREEYVTVDKSGIVRDILTKHKFKKNYSELSEIDAKNLTPKEGKIIKDYTYNGFKDMNRLLYAPERSNYNAMEKKRLQEKIDVLTDFLDKKSLEQQGIFYRGMDSGTAVFGSDVFKMSLQKLREKYEGSIYVNKGFSSMSFSKKTAEGFSGDDGGVLIEARIPQGARAFCVGSVGTFGASEGEILLQRGTSYKIDKIDFRGGKFHVKMTAVGVAK